MATLEQTLILSWPDVEAWAAATGLRVRKSIEQAVALIVVLLLIATLITSVILMFNAEAENVKLINSLIQLSRPDETIPLRVSNSQLRIGIGQGFLSSVLVE